MRTARAAVTVAAFMTLVGLACAQNVAAIVPPEGPAPPPPRAPGAIGQPTPAASAAARQAAIETYTRRFPISEAKPAGASICRPRQRT